MRNRILALLAAAAGLWACNGSRGYTIQGPAEGDYAILNIWNTENGETLRDTVAIENGKFVFKGSVDDVFMGEVLVFADGKEPVRHVVHGRSQQRFHARHGCGVGRPGPPGPRFQRPVASGYERVLPGASGRGGRGLLFLCVQPRYALGRVRGRFQQLHRTGP